MLQSCRQGVRSCVSRGATGRTRLTRRWVASTADDDEGADAGDDLQPEALALGPSVDAYASYGRWFKLDRKSAGLPGGPTGAPKQAPVQRKHASRQLLNNPETADKIVRAWGLHKSKPLTIVEINAGNGVLTRSLLDQGHRVLAIEDHKGLKAAGELETLAKRHQSLEVKRDIDASYIHAWRTLSTERADLAPRPWSEEPDVAVVVHISPNAFSYQFLPLCAMMAPSRSLMYVVGRVTVYALAPTYHATRICPSSVANPPDSAMHFTIENTLEPRVVDVDLQTDTAAHYRKILTGRGGGGSSVVPMTALVLPARREPLFGNDDWQSFRYVVNGLYARPALSWIKQLNAIGHGASDAVPRELAAAGVEIPATLRVRDLSLTHMADITRAFMRWPFHPDARPLASTLSREEFRNHAEH